jgi:hypothetical protein
VKMFSGNVVTTAPSGFLQPALQDRLFDSSSLPALRDRSETAQDDKVSMVFWFLPIMFPQLVRPCRILIDASLPRSADSPASPTLLTMVKYIPYHSKEGCR